MTPRDILIIKPSSMGDVLQALPAVHCLKRTYPTAKLQWLINPEWSPLLTGNPDLAEIILFPRGQFRGFQGLVRAVDWARALRRLRPDLALDFQGLLRSALLSRATRPKRLLGLADAREGSRLFYDDTAPTSRETQHGVDRYLALAALAGAEVSGEPVFRLPAGQPFAAFELPSRYLLLHPFARGRGKSLTWLEICRLAQGLAPWPVILVGIGARKSSLPRNAISLVNQTSLPELIWLIRQATFTVSVDSGPMHLAAALTDDLLSIHFWSNPRQVGPYRPDAWVWKQGACSRMRDLPDTRSDRRDDRRPDPEELAQFLHERLLRAAGRAVN
ncbi:MAG: glycosyltransferase family 9 protein [Verrucomicrobia bacterium]|nr:glycosyltransferase family 9 protein [Verrucomicrobiota bacterium]